MCVCVSRNSVYAGRWLFLPDTLVIFNEWEVCLRSSNSDVYLVKHTYFMCVDESRKIEYDGKSVLRTGEEVERSK